MGTTKFCANLFIEFFNFDEEPKMKEIDITALQEWSSLIKHVLKKEGVTSISSLSHDGKVAF